MRPGRALTMASLAEWLNVEYRRTSAWPRGRHEDELVRSGRLAVLAEMEAIVKSGVLPRHCACKEEWLMQQAREATVCAALLGEENEMVEGTCPVCGHERPCLCMAEERV